MLPNRSHLATLLLVPALLAGACAGSGSGSGSGSRADSQSGAPGAPASGLDWSAVADTPVIEILTVDEDGALRETKVWFVLIDGVSYLRTNDSRWLANLRRDPKIAIRIDGTSHPQLAHEVTNADLIEKVDAASRAKYGWQDAFIHFFRVGDPDIVELSDPGY